MVRTLVVILAAALLVSGCTLTVDPTEYAPKKAGDCAAGEKPCGYKCVTVNDPGTGCGGASCDACPGGPANSVAACGSDGQCGFDCNPGWGDCSNGPVDGCETRVDGSASCGSCGRSCTLPSTCDPVALVCAPVGTYATGGPTKGIDGSPATGLVYALVQQGTSGVFGYIADVVASTSLSIVQGDLGYVSALSIGSDGAWFGRSAGLSQLGFVGPLAPPIPAAAWKDSVPSPGPAVDVATSSSLGTLWIPDAGRGVRHLASTGGVGSEVPVTSLATAVTNSMFGTAMFVAGVEQNGTIWRSSSPSSAGNYSLMVDGAGNVGAMAAVDLGIETLLYWVDLDRGDVWRYEVNAGRKDRIFQGAGPAAMWIDVDEAGDPYWTHRSTGTLMTWKSYGGRPKAVHVIGRSPSPGRVYVNAALVFWADDTEQVIRAVQK